MPSPPTGPARTWLDTTCWIDYHPAFFDDGIAARERLVQDTEWAQEEITIMGRTVLQPRLTAWFGVAPDASSRYRTYSAVNPWPASIGAMRDTLEVLTGTPFNACLANLYRSGHDSVAWHADDEPALGPAPMIASVSLGAARRFLLKRRVDGLRHELVLGGGDLLVMGGDTQRSWVHAVPRTAKPVGARINLTFRCYDIGRLEPRQTSGVDGEKRRG